MAIDTAHAAIRSILLADAGVTAITSVVSPWTLWHADQLPAVTYSLVSNTNTYAYDGEFASEQARYQLTAWSDDYDQAFSLAEAIKSALGGLADQLENVVFVHRIRIGDVSDLDDDPESGRNLPPYGIRIDVAIHYEITA